MRRRIAKYRRSAIGPGDNPQIGCILLAEPFLWKRSGWIRCPGDCASNTVVGKGYDSEAGVGRVLRLRASMLPDAVTFSEGRVRGFIHRASGDGRDGLVLTHGAGGNARMALLEAVARAFADAGICVLRCDLSFRLRRPYGPPSPDDAAEDRAGLKEAATVMRRLVSGRVFLGGQSYGGRQASVLAAEDGAVTEGLLLLSYPLHPPSRPQQARTSHWPALRTPALFVHGSRDLFASNEELRAAVALIPAVTRIVEIEGAGHDLRRGAWNVKEMVVEPFLELMAR